jgi:3-oxoacyl-ACP reductase-like protein
MTPNMRSGGIAAAAPAPAAAAAVAAAKAAVSDADDANAASAAELLVASKGKVIKVKGGDRGQIQKAAFNVGLLLWGQASNRRGLLQQLSHPGLLY